MTGIRAQPRCTPGHPSLGHYAGARCALVTIAELGFEPRQRDSKSLVLPLDDSALLFDVDLDVIGVHINFLNRMVRVDFSKPLDGLLEGSVGL